MIFEVEFGTSAFKERVHNVSFRKGDRMSAIPRVFEVERSKKALIVAPQGDAVSFRESDIRDELRVLHGLIDEPGIPNLVVDLGNANYFGSAIIGAIAELGEKVVQSDGRINVCNASEEMQRVLHALQLDSVWDQYPSRRKALKALKR